MSAAPLLAGGLFGIAANLFLSAGKAHRRGQAWRVHAATGFGLCLAGCAVEREWPGVAANAVLVVVLLGSDWWNRKGRKAAKALGLKSLAVLAAVVERAREAGTPVPEGARG